MSFVSDAQSTKRRGLDRFWRWRAYVVGSNDYNLAFPVSVHAKTKRKPVLSSLTLPLPLPLSLPPRPPLPSSLPLVCALAFSPFFSERLAEFVTVRTPANRIVVPEIFMDRDWVLGYPSCCT